MTHNIELEMGLVRRGSQIETPIITDVFGGYLKGVMNYQQETNCPAPTLRREYKIKS